MMQTPFIWGQKGQQLTPDQVERLRVVSALATRAGSDTSPVGHWTQGLARVVDALGAYRGNQRADAQEAAGLASADEAIKGNPALSSLLGGDQAGMATPSPVVNALAQQLTQTMPVTSAPGTAGAFAGAGGLPSSIVQSESGGNWNALNSEGYGGRGQFGTERLADAARAGIIPAGMTGLEYSKAPEAVQLAVENWHKADILGDLGQYVGVDPDGAGPIPPLTENSLLAVAHLGGKGGAKQFVETGGRYNPSDSNGTSLADYAIRHAGGAAMPASGGGSAPNNIVALLAQAQANPWVQKKHGGVIEALMGQQMRRDDASFEQQMRQSDPMYQAQLQQAQLQLEQARTPVREPIEVGGVLLDPVTYQPIFDSRQGVGSEGFTLSPGQQRFDATGQPIAAVPEAAPQQYRTISGSEASQLGLDPAQAYNIGPDGKITQIGGGGTNVTVNNAGADKFAEAFASGDAATLNTVSDAGMSAQRNLARVDRLENLLSQGPSGLEAGVKSLAGEYGIKTEGLDTLQAAQALINTMVPEQRQPGSGPMSDADLALYKQSLPRLINTAEGNALITHTLRGIAQYDAEGAQIVQRLRAGEIDRATAFEMLQSRQNPLAGFGEQASRFQAPGSAEGLSGADWQDVNGMPGVQIRVK